MLQLTEGLKMNTTNKIVSILMERDGMERGEAENLFWYARAAVEDGQNPKEILEDWFGLEPDYLDDLLG